MKNMYKLILLTALCAGSVNICAPERKDDSFNKFKELLRNDGLIYTVTLGGTVTFVSSIKTGNSFTTSTMNAIVGAAFAGAMYKGLCKAADITYRVKNEDK